MHFPRYWAKASHQGRNADGDPVEMACWRSSDESLQAAQALADVAAKSLVERFIETGRPPDSYGYSDRPLREPVLRELKDAQGQLVAAVTRNAHGCEVLNTTAAMFVDIDFEQVGGQRPLPKVIPIFKDKHPEIVPLARVESFAKQRPEWGLRVYRTTAGLRVLVTHAPIDSGSALADEVLDALDADPLYRRLCGLQESYRARLTPKHWRCKADEPPCVWPFSDAAQEAEFEDWQRTYRQLSEQYATCELLRTFGSADVHPDIAPILELHDAACGVGETLPLA